MFKLLKGLDLTNTYAPVDFVVADTDAMSIDKLKQFATSSANFTNYNVHAISRSRRVGQSYLTSVFTTLLAFCYALPLVWRLRPSLLLVNGPGTCLPICFIVFVLARVLCLLPRCRIVFVESICRVQRLSLTGKLFYWTRITSDFIVQWPELKQKYPRSVYLGRLV